MTDEKLSEILSGLGFEIFGCCEFEKAGKLFQTRNRQNIPENAKSIITFLFPYKIPCEKRNISLYCIGRDYHDIILKKLEKCAEVLKREYPENAFFGFCDNSPINEVRAAFLSGLGVLGKNGLIINEKYGSYCFIGEIVSDLKLGSYSNPLGQCIGCEKCLGGCPSLALSLREGDTYFLDREKCISALTQKKGALTAEQEALIKKGGLIWGCDKCLENCPLNKNAKDTPIEDFYLDTMCVLSEGEINSKISDRAYGYKGKDILMRNLGIIGK